MRRNDSNNVNSQLFDKAFGCFMIVTVLLVLAIIVTAVIVAVHFLSKVW